MLNVPIPPLPLPPAQPIQAPARPISPDPGTSRRIQRVQELLHHPQLPVLFREAVRRFQALPLKIRNPTRRGWINEYKYDRMYNSQSILCRGFNACLTSARLLELKQNHDAFEPLERLPHWLRRGITFSLLMY